MEQPKTLLAAIWLPLVGLLAFISFYLVWGLLGLPSDDEIIVISETYFEQYGLITIFIAAILEGMLFAGWYFPGSLVIVLGVVFAGNNYPQLFGVFLLTTIGLVIAHIINFYVGKYGWYRVLSALGFQGAIEKAKSQLVQYGPRAIFFTYWHPNLAALTATAAGILNIPFRTFLLYSIVATTVWDIFWTILGYSLGQAAITAIGPKFVIGFVTIWIASILIYELWQRYYSLKTDRAISE
jgi:membrane-associated protein